MYKVSIIVPTYNVENYLHECMDSIINQTLKDIEIICIDDGSTDNSGKILDEYASKDSRIKVIHKENGGYGKAMNIGLDNATGEYIGIVEPDDYIELNMYEELYTKANSLKLDFIKGDYYKYSTLPEVKNQYFSTFNKSKVYDKVIKPTEHLEVFNGGASIWSAIYKHSFLKTNNIRFLETAGASFQDTSFWIKVLLDAKTGLFVKKAYNHYRIDNTNSSVKQNNKVFCICDELHELENRYKTNSTKQKIINSLKIDKYSWNYKRLNTEGQNTFRQLFIKECRPIITKKNYFSEITNNEMLNIYQEAYSKTFAYRIVHFIFTKYKTNTHHILKVLGIKIQFKRRKKCLK